ncbi:acyltransferase family protein [Klebsiella sp. NPDC088457]
MNNRIVGLDLLRSIIMIFGPTFHASMLMDGAFGFDGYFSQTKVTYSILHYTNPFRMELFFIISGFFASLVLEKKGIAHYSESRKQRILKPTIVALVVILPLTCILMYGMQGYTDLNGYFSYRHLWFLVTLSFISLLTLISPLFILNAARQLGEYLNKKSFFSITVYFCSALIFFQLISRVATRVLPESIEILFQVGNVLFYIMPFFIGMVIFYIVKKPTIKTIVFYAIVFTVWYSFSVSSMSYMSLPGLSKTLMKDIFSTIMCLSVFYFFFSLKIQSNKLISELSRVALPFYLLHLPVLILLSGVYSRVVNDNSDTLYSLTVIPLTMFLSYCASWFLTKNNLVRRSLGLI